MSDYTKTFRNPSAAQFMIDSLDRVTGASTNAGSLSYTTNFSWVNGYFTRLAVTEACLEWAVPNIIGTDVSGYQFACDISGTTSGTILRIPNGFYSVAELIDAVAASMNSTGLFGTVSVVQNYMTPQGVKSGQVAIYATGGFRFSANQPQTNISRGLNSLLQVVLGGPFATYKAIGINPDVRLFRYLDFVSPQLTYVQSVKDSNTTAQPYDVLLRWYMERTDDQTIEDKYGYPIPYGCYQVRERRLFNPPKYIRWDTNLPVGNFDINVLWQGNLAASGAAQTVTDLINAVSVVTGQTKSSMFKYLMTIQLSEN